MFENYIFYAFLTSSFFLIVSEILPFTSLKYHGIIKIVVNSCNRKKNNQKSENLEKFLIEKETYDSDNEYSLYTDIEIVKQKLNIIIDGIEEIQETQEKQKNIENEVQNLIKINNKWFFQKIF